MVDGTRGVSLGSGRGWKGCRRRRVGGVVWLVGWWRWVDEGHRVGGMEGRSLGEGDKILSRGPVEWDQTQVIKRLVDGRKLRTKTKSPPTDNVGMRACVVCTIERIAHGDDAAGVGSDRFTRAPFNFEPAGEQGISGVVGQGDLRRRAYGEKGAYATVSMTRG